MSSMAILVENSTFAWCDDKYRHIWDAVSKLSECDPRLAVVVDCLDVPLEVAQKKAHNYAKRFKIPVTCRTRFGERGLQLYIRRCPDQFRREDKQGKASFIAKVKAREMLGYSYNCSVLNHTQCKGQTNVGNKRVACACPCHGRKTQ